MVSSNKACVFDIRVEIADLLHRHESHFRARFDVDPAQIGTLARNRFGQPFQ